MCACVSRETERERGSLAPPPTPTPTRARLNRLAPPPQKNNPPQLRHPNILAYRDAVEVPDGRGGVAVYLVTEPATPLLDAMRDLDAEMARGPPPPASASSAANANANANAAADAAANAADANNAGPPPSSSPADRRRQRDEYLATGVLHMARAVAFLNNDCGLVHGHVCGAAVLVTETLDWKLSGFDFVTEHQSVGSLGATAFLAAAPAQAARQYVPGELARGDWRAVAEGPAWAVDAWGLGCLIREAFSGAPLAAMEQLRDTACIPPSVLPDYQRLLASTPARRLNPAAIAASALLNSSRLVEAVAFLEAIAVKDASEKDAFFRRHLPQALGMMPQAVAARKVLPLLARSLEFGGAPPSALASLLRIGRGMREDEYSARLVPVLARLYASPDRAVRRALLESLDLYVPHLTARVVEEQIYPPLSAGFSDENAYVRELTLKAVLPLAPRLSQATLTQGLLKHLSRLQVDPEPSIRANTTVLLGNVAPLLGDAVAKRVLLNAFGRALRDGFPPARCAALRALAATLRYYAPEELAARALPAVAPLAVDPVCEVRSAALACVEAFARVLREHDGKMAAAARAAAERAAAAGGGAVGGGAVGGAVGSGGAAAGAGGGGMGGWGLGGSATASGISAGSGGSGGLSRGAGAGGGMVSFGGGGGGYGGVAPAAAAASGGGYGSGGGGGGGSGGGSRMTATATSAVGGWDDLDDGPEDDATALEAERRARQSVMGGAQPSSAARTAAGGPRPVAAGARHTGGGGGGGGAPIPAPAARVGGHVQLPAGLTMMGAAAADDDGGWEDMAAPTALKPASAPRAPAGGMAAARARPAMKLGAKKLGPGGIDFDETKW